MELGVIGMMLKIKQSVAPSVVLKLTALAQVALLLFVGSAANAHKKWNYRLEAICVFI